MLGVIGTFGSLPFMCSADVVHTFKDLSRETSTRWARHEVIGQKPVLEWIGDDLARITFKIRFDATLRNPPVAGLIVLNRLLKSHESHVLVIGGEYLGKFVIESVSENRKHFAGAGVCLVAEATITLTEAA